jgi:hypothetical protein
VLLRWILRLAEYDFTVKYSHGAKIPHIDSLSRNVCAMTAEPEVSKSRMRLEQEKEA